MKRFTEEPEIVALPNDATECKEESHTFIYFKNVICFHHKYLEDVPAGLGYGECGCYDIFLPRGFRKILSSYYADEPLEIDGYTFMSAEHAFHFFKYKKKHIKDGNVRDSIVFGLTLESNSHLSNETGPPLIDMIKDLKLYLPHDNYDTNIRIYIDVVKFSKGMPKRVLLATGDAELYKDTEHIIYLEEIREYLRTGKPFHYVSI